MSRARGRVATVVASVAVLVLSACGGGGGDGGGGGGGEAQQITVWTGDTLPDRVAATEAIIERFTQQTGVAVELVGVDEDQFNQLLTSAAAAGELPDVVGSQPLAAVRTLAANDLVDVEATAAVIEALGADSFDQRALELTREGEEQLAVPSDAWSQLLYYRRDLFEAAGLAPPTTYDEIRAAAEALNQGGVSGFVGATAPGDAFTQQTFEHIALANGCELVDPEGAITINSPECVAAFQFYGDLTRLGPPGAQDVDTVRASYFAGQAAMAIWSTFLLDELAGLRNDALPSCAECQADPRFLSTNTGIVAAIEGPDGQPAQFGEVSSWAIPVDANAEAAQQFVQFMLSDGYSDWLAIAPEGKYPVRQGDGPGATEFVDAWESSPIGVDTKAPIADIYPQEVLDVLTSGPEAFSRWGITQGQGDLIGASLGELPVPEAVAAVTTGGVPAQQAADQAAATLQQIQDSLR